MLTLVAAIFAASVLGSLHCAGMCGAFLGIALGRGDAIPWKTQAAYHLGRLATYVSLGAAAGFAGKAIDLAGALAGIRPLAILVAGAAMLTFGLVSFLRLRGVPLPGARMPAFARALSDRGYRIAMRRDVTARAALIGLLTTLLPCGWLYAFVGTAAGTASPAMGALAMSVFWAGTLPVMVTLGAGIRGATGWLGRRAPLVTSLAMMALGLVTLVNRSQLDPRRLMTQATTARSLPNPHAKPACCTTEAAP